MEKPQKETSRCPKLEVDRDPIAYQRSSQAFLADPLEMAAAR